MAAGLPTDKWKLSLDDYVASAISLCNSMESCGFLDEGAVPVDLDGELLQGAHRVACALAIRIESIPIIEEYRRAWAPAWDLDFLAARGMSAGDLNRVAADFDKISAK